MSANVPDTQTDKQLKKKKKKRKPRSRKPSEVQAVVFGKNWTAERARNWIDKRGWKAIKRVHKTSGGFLRYRLKDPDQYKRFIWKSTPQGVNFVLGFK